MTAIIKNLLPTVGRFITFLLNAANFINIDAVDVDEKGFLIPMSLNRSPQGKSLEEALAREFPSKHLGKEKSLFSAATAPN